MSINSCLPCSNDPALHCLLVGCGEDAGGEEKGQVSGLLRAQEETTGECSGDGE